MWSPHTAIDIYKLESVQRRAARWVTRDYRYTSSVTAMLKDLNWRPLDQRRIDSRLVLMYKVTYDLVAIPALDYLVHNTSQSRHSHPLAYRQIPTLRDYYKYILFPRTIIHWNAVQAHIPVLPTLAHFSTAVCFYLLTVLTLFFALYKLISPAILYFISIYPLQFFVYWNTI